MFVPLGGPHRVTRVDVARAVATVQGYPEARVRPVNRAAQPVAPGATPSPADIAMDSTRLWTHVAAADRGGAPRDVAAMVREALRP